MADEPNERHTGSFQMDRSAQIAGFIEREFPESVGADGLFDALHDAFPSITFHEFVGGWHLWRAMSGAEGYDLAFLQGREQ